MKAQIPAEGILIVNNYGNSKIYKAVCSCGDDDCSHTIDIEADDAVNVTVYTRTKTNFWNKTRWHHIWTLLTRGYIDFETTIILDRQSALNYAKTIENAIVDVENFKKDQNGNS